MTQPRDAIAAAHRLYNIDVLADLDQDERGKDLDIVLEALRAEQAGGDDGLMIAYWKGVYDERDRQKAASVAPDVEKLNVDKFANFIRTINGNNNMGHGELAERILNHLAPLLSGRVEGLLNKHKDKVFEFVFFGTDAERDELKNQWFCTVQGGFMGYGPSPSAAIEAALGDGGGE